MLFTRRGDGGHSALLNTKERFRKDAPIFEALGTLDELNAILGMCRAEVEDAESTVPRAVLAMQERLFIIQSELAGSDKTVSQTHIDELEVFINKAEEEAGNPHAFVIAGATRLSALFDFARTVARRAERAVIRADADAAVSTESRAYLNRLSSGLYALARISARRQSARELSPSYR